MNTKWIVSALAIVSVFGVAGNAVAQKKSGAETGLIGIKLYDSGVRVVSIYGTPDEVQAVGGGGNAIGPGGGAAGGPGRGGPSPAGGGGGAGAGAGIANWHTNAFDFANNLMQRGGKMGGLEGGGDNAGVSGPPGAGAPGAGAPGGGGGGGAVGAGGSSGRILYTRWVYNRSGSKYGFVLDKSNRVVQIEAIGLTNAKVRTSRGVGFGSTFAQLIKKYNSPDGYEINGDNVVVRFLVKNKVAFRLSRLGPNRPQVVTGIVVAAGKT